MRTSDGRILTTHAGSLPRPKPLVELFARRAQGEAIDEAELERQIEAATQAIVPKQIAAGIDIPNNGEQPREAFFLYVRRRMSGFGGKGTRKPPADVAHYPGFQALRQRFVASQPMVTNFEVPKVTGAVRYLDPGAVQRECADFRRILSAAAPQVPEAFVTAPSPGIIAAAIPNEHYANETAYLDALAEALRVEYEAIVENGFLLQIDAPDLALERHVTFADRPVREFVAFVERVIAAITVAANSRNSPTGRPAKLTCRSSARSGASICSRKPCRTIASYSTRSASARAST